MEQTAFESLLLITGVAVVVPFVLNRIPRFPVPIVVGEIMAGIVIGRSGFDLVQPSETLTFLSEFGFAFLMFLSGIEIDFNLLSLRQARRQEGPVWKQPLPLAILVFFGTLALGLVGGTILTGLGLVSSPLLMGLVLSTTSLGVVVPILKETDILDGPYGQTLLVNATIADFATLILLTVVIALNSSGLTLELLLIPALLVVFMLVFQAAQRVTRWEPVLRLIRDISSTTSQIRVRIAFALMVAWVVLAEVIGVELILGAFLAGALVGLVADSDASTARTKMDAIGYGFFIPIFFIMVGVQFNLPSLLSSSSALLLVPALVVAAYLVKAIPTLILRANYSIRNTLAAGVLLSARLSLIIAAAAIALDVGAISVSVNSAVVLLAIISCTAAPLIFRRVTDKPERRQRHGIILVGSDQMTELLARNLSIHDEPVSILCTQPGRAASMREHGEHLKVAGPTDRDALIGLGAERARALVDLTTAVDETMRLAELAVEDLEIPLVVSRISDVELIPRLQRMGVRVVQPALATVMSIEGALRYPTTFDILVHKAKDVEVGEVRLGNHGMVGAPVRDLRLPGNALIVSLKREETILVPDGDTRLRMGDRLDLIGDPESIDRSVSLLRGVD